MTPSAISCGRTCERGVENDFGNGSIDPAKIPGSWGRGYAKESCNALIEKAFGEGIHRIYAECDPENPNSWRFLESLGFAKEAHFKENVYFWKDEEGTPSGRIPSYMRC